MARPFIVELLGNMGATRDIVQLRLNALEARYQRIVGSEGADSPRAVKLKRRIDQDRAITTRIAPRAERAEERLRRAAVPIPSDEPPDTGTSGPFPGAGSPQAEAAEHIQRVITGILPGDLVARLRAAGGRSSSEATRPPEDAGPGAQATEPEPTEEPSLPVAKKRLAAKARPSEKKASKKSRKK